MIEQVINSVFGQAYPDNQLIGKQDVNEINIDCFSESNHIMIWHYMREDGKRLCIVRRELCRNNWIGIGMI